MRRFFVVAGGAPVGLARVTRPDGRALTFGFIAQYAVCRELCLELRYRARGQRTARALKHGASRRNLHFGSRLREPAVLSRTHGTALWLRHPRTQQSQVAHAVRLGNNRDQVVKLPRDPHGTLLRLVCFTCAGHQFRLITNRFDLATHDLVLLYAWRWQVELLFRAWKHTLGGLHLLNLSAAGIAIQFYVLLLAALLWTLTQQTAEHLSAAKPKPALSAPQTMTGSLSQLFQRAWRLRRQPLRLCANCLAQPFSCYLKERLVFAT